MRKLSYVLLVIISANLSCFVPAVSGARGSTTAIDVSAGPFLGDPAVASAAERKGLSNLMTSHEFQLSLLILAFGVVIVVIEYLLLRDVIKEKTEVISRTYTVTLIIVGTMFLITAGYSSDQISPAIGLFGTIAGYLLGRIDQHPGKRPANQRRTANETKK